MLQFIKYFSKGLNKTLRLHSGTNFSYSGPWINLVDLNDRLLDSWYVGDFMSADYTVVVDHTSSQKEVLKCLVVASPDSATLTIYGRTDLQGPLINLVASVDSSRLFLYASPVNANTKVFFSANYYQTVNPIIPSQLS